MIGIVTVTFLRPQDEDFRMVYECCLYLSCIPYLLIPTAIPETRASKGRELRYARWPPLFQQQPTWYSSQKQRTSSRVTFHPNHHAAVLFFYSCCFRMNSAIFAIFRFNFDLKNVPLFFYIQDKVYKILCSTKIVSSGGKSIIRPVWVLLVGMADGGSCKPNRTYRVCTSHL